MVGLAPEQYKETLLFLGTAGLIVPLFRRLRISPVIGFLSAGAALGPFGLGSIANRYEILHLIALDDVHAIEPIAAFGVVFLLFMIGLELSFERLTRLRRLVFGFGALQLGSAAVALGLLAVALGQPATAATILGAGLALSSTAVVIPVMVERRRLGSAAGRAIFSVLLFQDLMVAPLLVLVSMLKIGTGSLWVTLATTLLPAAAALIVIVAGGRLLMRPLFHHVAAAGSTEFFMAACLLVVIGTSVLTAASGLSMGLGAFISGLLLAETEYRREIEVTIEPFKGLLLGLFFVAVGAELDVSRLLVSPGPTIGLALGFIAIKIVTTYASARVVRLPWRTALESSLMLASGGEFAFVLIAAAVDGKLLSPVTATDANLSVTLSLFAVPLFATLTRRLTRKAPRADEELAVVPQIEAGAQTQAILIGFGRVGRLVGEMMRKHEIAYLALDENAATVREHRRRGVNIAWGNARRLELLERCGLATTSALIVTLDDADAAEEIVKLVRDKRPDLTIVARARDAESAARLYALGATDAVPETIEASLQLSEAVLADLGIAMGLVIASVHEKREEFRKVLQPVTSKAREKRAVRMSSRVKDMQKRNDAAKRKALGASAET